MNDFDIPIFKKAYDLYKELAALRASVPKRDRYTLWQRVENAALDVIENILHASGLPKPEKMPSLMTASAKLNLLRFLIRLAHDTKVITGQKYTALQQAIDAIGRQLGGWVKSLQNPNAP